MDSTITAYLDTADIATTTLEKLVIQVTHFLWARNQLRKIKMNKESHILQRDSNSSGYLVERGRECC
jgi:hypothetical protein